MMWTFVCTCRATSAFPTPRIIAELLAIEHLARHKDDSSQTILFREEAPEHVPELLAGEATA